MISLSGKTNIQLFKIIKKIANNYGDRDIPNKYSKLILEILSQFAIRNLLKIYSGNNIIEYMPSDLYSNCKIWINKMTNRNLVKYRIFIQNYKRYKCEIKHCLELKLDISSYPTIRKYKSANKYSFYFDINNYSDVDDIGMLGNTITKMVELGYDIKLFSLKVYKTYYCNIDKCSNCKRKFKDLLKYFDRDNSYVAKLFDKMIDKYCNSANIAKLEMIHNILIKNNYNDIAARIEDLFHIPKSAV